MGNYVTFNVNVKGKSHKVQIEKGVTFENNTKTYKVDNSGKLQIFDKNTKKWTSGSSISMTNYQFQVFRAVADNAKEGNGIILSSKDIDKSFELYKNGKLTEDLSKGLPTGYKIERPEIYSKNKAVKVGVKDDVKKQTAATLTFSYGDKAAPAAGSSNKPSNKGKTQSSKPAGSAANKPSSASKSNRSSAASNNHSVTTNTGVSSNSDYFPFVGMSFGPSPFNLMSAGRAFNNSSINKSSSFTYTIKNGDSIVSLAREYGIDTYTLLAANPGIKYDVKYRKYDTAVLNTEKLSIGQKIVIPERYTVKPGSVKNFSDIARITGVSEDYIKNTLAKNEGLKLKPYRDSGGVVTIGYGHTGRYKGKPITMKYPKSITKQEALELLTNDILEHKQRTIAYLGTPYLNAPKSVQDTILDITFNKGIFDGFMHPYHSIETRKIAADLTFMNYSGALAHTPRTNNSKSSAGLDKRNVLRFIHGLRDLSFFERTLAMTKFQPYYDLALQNNKNASVRRDLEHAWENAKLGRFD